MFNTAPGLNAGQVDFAFSQKGFKNWSTSTICVFLKGDNKN